jgi:hypothetical protein
MTNAGHGTSVSVDAVVNSLRIQGITFHGPFHTPSGAVFLVIGRHIFLAPELVDLLAQNKLNRESIQALAERIDATNSSQSQ